MHHYILIYMYSNMHHYILIYMYSNMHHYILIYMYSNMHHYILIHVYMYSNMHHISSPRRAAWCISFFGIHPTLTQVPPRPEENRYAIYGRNIHMIHKLLCMMCIYLLVWCDCIILYCQPPPPLIMWPLSLVIVANSQKFAAINIHGSKVKFLIFIFVNFSDYKTFTNCKDKWIEGYIT